MSKYCKYLDNKIANSINYITLKSDCISGIIGTTSLKNPTVCPFSRPQKGKQNKTTLL